MKNITPLTLLLALAAPAMGFQLPTQGAPSGSTSFYDFNSNDGLPAYLRDDFVGPRTEQQEAEYQAAKQQQNVATTDPCVPWRIPCKLPEEKLDLSKDGAIPNQPGENWVEHKTADGKTVWNRCTATMCEVQPQSCESNPSIPPCKAQEEQRKLAEAEKLKKEQEKKNNCAYGWNGAGCNEPGNEKSMGGFGLMSNNSKSRAPGGAPAPSETPAASAEDKNKSYGPEGISAFDFDPTDGQDVADNSSDAGPDPKSMVDDMLDGAPDESMFAPRREGEKGLGDLGGVSALFNPTDNGDSVVAGGPGGAFAATEKTSAIATVSNFQKPIGAQDNTLMGRVWTWMQRFDKAGAPTMREDMVRPDYKNTNSFGTRRPSPGPVPSDG